MIKAGESERDHHAAMPPRSPRVTPAGEEWSAYLSNVCRRSPYHLARAPGPFNPLNRVEALCWRSSS